MKLITTTVLALFAASAFATGTTNTATPAKKEEAKPAVTATATPAVAKTAAAPMKKECKKGDTKCEAEMKKEAKH